MQLTTTESSVILSTEYLKYPSSIIERSESRLKISEILRSRFFASVSISDYRMEESIEISVTLQIQRGIRKLEELYTFNNPKEIKSFLLANNYLIDILSEAPAHVGRIFGIALLHLELHHDPEERWDELFIVIRSLCSPEEAIRLENRLAEEWFLDRMKETDGKLNITEEPL